MKTSFCCIIWHTLIYILSSLIQVAALKRGLLSVIPQAVLDLMTWQELERWICGDPDVTIEALKRSSKS